MIGTFRAAAVASGVIFALSNAAPGFAQKRGGVLKLSHFDSPARPRVGRSGGQSRSLLLGSAATAAMLTIAQPKMSSAITWPDPVDASSASTGRGRETHSCCDATVALAAALRRAATQNSPRGRSP